MIKENYQPIAATFDDFTQIKDLLIQVNLPLEGVAEHITHFKVLKELSKDQTSSMIVGCIGLEIYEKYGLLRSLAIHPKNQGSGFGTLLTAEIISYAKEIGLQKLFLRTTTAEEFFKKRGFISISLNEIPEIVKRSVEFNSSVCPESTVNMVMTF